MLVKIIKYGPIGLETYNEGLMEVFVCPITHAYWLCGIRLTSRVFCVMREFFHIKLVGEVYFLDVIMPNLNRTSFLLSLGLLYTSIDYI